MDELRVPTAPQRPDDWWLWTVAAKHLLKYFRNHVLALFVHAISPTQVITSSYSGFLLSYDGRLLWLTAGHVIDSLSHIFNPLEFRVGHIRWMDTFEDQDGPHTPVPFHYVHDLPRMRSWYEDGYDVGVMELKLLDQDGILRNPNIVPFEFHRGTSRYDAIEPAGNYIVGFPQEFYENREFVTSDGQKHAMFSHDLACVPVRPVEPKDSDDGDGFWRHPKDLYVELVPYVDHPEASVKDPAGMSGAPIIAFKEGNDGGASARVIGIEGGWLPSAKTIRAVRTIKMIELLDGWK